MRNLDAFLNTFDKEIVTELMQGTTFFERDRPAKDNDSTVIFISYTKCPWIIFSYYKEGKGGIFCWVCEYTSKYSLIDPDK